MYTVVLYLTLLSSGVGERRCWQFCATHSVIPTGDTDKTLQMQAGNNQGSIQRSANIF